MWDFCVGLHIYVSINLPNPSMHRFVCIICFNHFSVNISYIYTCIVYIVAAKKREQVQLYSHHHFFNAILDLESSFFSFSCGLGHVYRGSPCQQRGRGLSYEHDHSSYVGFKQNESQSKPGILVNEWNECMIIVECVIHIINRKHVLVWCIWKRSIPPLHMVQFSVNMMRWTSLFRSTLLSDKPCRTWDGLLPRYATQRAWQFFTSFNYLTRQFVGNQCTQYPNFTDFSCLNSLTPQKWSLHHQKQSSLTILDFLACVQQTVLLILWRYGSKLRIDHPQK